jgi:4a-hydroxytetrahydrobiopterin dehydratase
VTTNEEEDDMDETLTATQISQNEGLDDWRVLLRTLQASFRTGSLAKGLEFAARIGAVADEANHHPDLTITYPRVHVLLTTHDAGGLTSKDVDLARTISAIARELGITAEPTTVTQLEVAIDALDIPAVKPFWEAVLGYKPDREDDSVDPYGRAPGFWFQQMDAPRPQRNRIHIDVTVPHDVAEQRIAAALAAGGRLVSDEAAPAFWVLADPEGNEACICTWQGRD